MNYQQTLEYLYAMLPMYQRIGQAAFKTDLKNTLALCQALGNPQHKFRSVHIAGTNGKGSSSHALAAVLQASGYKTGLYTSPHLKEFTERIRLNGAEISPAVVVDWVARNRAFIEKIQPSFFELTVAMAFDFFSQEGVDIAVIEVGMGGRLDSTNVIVPEVSLITNIGYDHMAVLGNTLPEIAAEKAGIIKAGRPVVVSEKQPETEEVFIRKAQELNAPLAFAGDTIKVFAGLEDFSCRILKNDLPWLSSLHPDIKASYFLKNLPGVLKTLEVMQQQGFTGITDENIKSGLENVMSLTGLKGRWQQLSEKPLVVADVSHNPDGIKELMSQVDHHRYDQLHMIIGTVNDKDVKKVLSLLPQKAKYYFCQADIPRALPAVALKQLASESGLEGEVIPGVNSAIALARERAGINDLILITGSTFVVAEIDEL